ncbi:MAG: hypothetical protein F4Y94_01845 [Chloroflexi bacterium]|nr:hypothetical protein [Chloroflexota bacterium]
MRGRPDGPADGGATPRIATPPLAIRMRYAARYSEAAGPDTVTPHIPDRTARGNPRPDERLIPMDGNQYIARILHDEGVREICCFPSSQLLEEAADLGIRPVMFRHERGAVMAADGYSRMSDGERFGVGGTQKAAGAENWVGGRSLAFADNVPILHLPGGYALAERQVRPNFSAAENYRGITK